LWSLAARDLPADSPDARIAARWHAIYTANRSLIGPDPDVIVPGLRLRLPGKDPS
jgi:nucleoid-associated protein YgaU